MTARAHPLTKAGPGPDGTIDPGILFAVAILQRAGIRTFESCEGGVGHCFAEPTIRFHGEDTEGPRALEIVERAGLGVSLLRRYWAIIDGSVTGPYWELIFHRTTP